MAGLVGCVKEIGKCILTQFIQPPVQRHIDYWWCFDNNIQGLRDGVRDLGREAYDIDQKIEETRLGTEILRPGVVEWFNLASEKLEEGRRILQDDNIPKAWNITSRYSMGKRAKKTAEEIAEVRNNGKFDRISDPASPPSTRFSSHRSTMDFESRKHIEEDIIQYLRSSSVSMVGICGMGGVGKTTMAERIGNKLKEENLFDEVVMVTVSEKIDILKIQEEIAEWLKLKFDEKHMSTRAAKLRTRLMDTKKKIIILDDVWESIKFEDLGIPIESNFERCKVLLTSRSKDTCKRIKNKKVFELKILEEKEAWILFKENAGKCVEDSALRSVAKYVAAECKGLPIALVTVGLTLQDETDIHAWNFSLSKLKQSNPTDLPEVMAEVYQPLKLSYDKLDTDVDKCFFLLCCLFPEDYHIPVEELTWYSMGLQMFDDISIEEATNKTHTLVGKLKSRFLLIDGYDKLHVKMHDVVRDIAIYIGSKEKNGFLQSLQRTSIGNSSDVNCNWISVDISNERMEVPVLSRFPKLRLLMLLKLSSNQFSDISFEGMKDINVLSFQSTSIGSLPPTLGSLENLQTLCLFRCQVQNISVIGELTSLKIFSCYECANITELPAEIGRLIGLRLLKLNSCHNLQRIPFGLISSLPRLEELKMRGSFSRWEAEENGKERRNASLTELGSLPNLTCLEIEIDDCTLSAQEICLSQNLVKYYIRIGSLDYWYDPRDYEKVMLLNLPGAVGNWIRLLARNVESLNLRGDGSDNINLAESEKLRNLEFCECSKVMKLVDISYLNQNVSLCNLKSIYIMECSNLKHVFSVSVARTKLLQLEFLEIVWCKSMEHVFSNEDRVDSTDGCIEFPKLKELRLYNLPNLTAFCQGLENNIIKFPSLTQMEIGGLPKLNSLLATTSPLQLEVLKIENCDKLEQVFWNEIRDDTDGCIEFPKLKELTLKHLPNLTAFCQGLENNIIKFPNLTEMWIVGLPKLNSLLARTSPLQLEVLMIENCDKLEQVFWNEIRDDADGCIEFPKLKKLRLVYLPNLTSFCQGLESISVKFPNLTQMWIGGLPKLNSLSPVNSETLVWHDQNTCFHFVCNPKVELGCLKDLRLWDLGDNIRNIWCYQIPNNVFNNLETLEICSMNGIRSLMSTSIAKNLVSLKYLSINNCKEMIEVIEGDDDDKQVADISCLFPNLRNLWIEKLPKLIRFCQWNHALELPLLEEVNIMDCPVMETFTLNR